MVTVSKEPPPTMISNKSSSNAVLFAIFLQNNSLQYKVYTALARRAGAPRKVLFQYLVCCYPGPDSTFPGCYHHNLSRLCFVLPFTLFRFLICTLCVRARYCSQTIGRLDHGSLITGLTVIVLGGGSIGPCGAKFRTKCPCLHNNNTALTKQIFLFDTLVMTKA